MPKRLFESTVVGLEQLEHLGGEIDVRRRRFLERAKDMLVADIRAHAPRRTGRHLDPSIQGKVLTEDTIQVGSFGFDGATALEDGATIRAKPRPTPTGRPSVLKFTGRDGTAVFRQQVILKRNAPKRGFFRKRLRFRGRILDQAFDETFRDL
jgi:hypothetical protein